MKRTFLLALFLSFSAIGLSAAHAADTPPPNIIFMMADDMGMGDTSAYQDFTGNADNVQLRTPAMERLARMGVRFTDAHTSSSRCTPTRYGLMTGRYPWRSRMKWWVLFGSQGDPMIEADRPTVATMLRDSGYRTAMFGKWHVGLRYRRSDGSPAAGWEDADLTKPLHTTPIDHGFDVAMFTSRSHGTSGPDAGAKPANPKKGKAKGKGKGRGKANSPNQNVGPGHIHGRKAVAATKNGKQLVAKGNNAYVLTELGGRHSDNAIQFLGDHITGNSTSGRPFFVYYPANSNHSPYTPDDEIGGKRVQGAARTVAGETMDARHDFIYENDVALGRMLDWLESNNDPRRPGHKLIENTVVIFTSDNGAEKNSNIASGPFRSHKGSCYEGGHRVPFIVSWPAGRVGDGDAGSPGQTNASPIGLQDMYATFAEIVGASLPDLRAGQKGAEDSVSVLSAFRGRRIAARPPLFFNDHKERKDDPAAAAMRLDSPKVDGRVFEGQWKIFYDASLLREGKARPYELFNLAADPWEKENLIDNPELKPLVAFLNRQALLHRNAGGHRIVPFAGAESLTFDWREGGNLHDVVKRQAERAGVRLAGTIGGEKVNVALNATGSKGAKDPAGISPNPRGIGVNGGKFEQVDEGEALTVRFDRDVIVDSVAIVAGNGACGGFYRVADKAPLAIYCVDADNDAKTQEGVISDIGLLKAGETLRLDSAPHLGVETPGRWRLGAISFRLAK